MLRIAWNGEKIDRNIFKFVYTCTEKFPLVSMGGSAEGLACADVGARTPIGASGNLHEFPDSCWSISRAYFVFWTSWLDMVEKVSILPTTNFVWATGKRIPESRYWFVGIFNGSLSFGEWAIQGFSCICLCIYLTSPTSESELYWFETLIKRIK